MTAVVDQIDQWVALLTSEEPDDRQRAASVSLPEATWREVIGRHPDLKVAVAQNKHVPLSVLELLAGDDDPLVRTWVAMKRKAGAALLERLAADADEGERQRVACNPRTPPAVLQRLEHDEAESVASAAQQALTERAVVVGGA